MALLKWEPMREIEDLFDRYTRSMGMPAVRGQEPLTVGDWTPRVDISETPTEFLVKAEIPEVKKEDVKVAVVHGVLTIQGERKQEKEENGTKFHRVERHFGRFVRAFTLPEYVDESQIKAVFKDGVLTLTIPKVEKAKPKTLDVKIE